VGSFRAQHAEAWSLQFITLLVNLDVLDENADAIAEAIIETFSR
jgi:hypothetical protein